LSFM